MPLRVRRHIQRVHLRTHGNKRAPRIGASHTDKLFRKGVRKRFEENAIHQTENRGVRTDSQRQGQNGHSAKGWVFRKHSHAVAYVLPERLHRILLR